MNRYATSEILKAGNSLSQLNKSTVPMTTVNGQNMRSIEDASKAIANIDVEKTINTMKIITSNINQQQVNLASAPNNTVVEVHIGTDKVKDLVSKVVSRQTTNTLTTPATLEPATNLR
jgi:hypothetical protein